MVLDFTSASIDATLASLGFVFARASTATRINASGVMESVASGAMRIEHDPVTGAPLGFLVEESSTNSVRNGDATGADKGTPGTLPTYWQAVLNGLSREVVEFGIESGMPYVDVRVYGTATSATQQIRLEQYAATVAVAGQVWTTSCYRRFVGGALTNVTSVDVGVTFRGAGGDGLSSRSTSGLPTADGLLAQRSSHSLSAPASTAFVEPFININVVNGATVDVTIRLGGAQCEQKPFATSYIATSGAARTRQLDALTLGDLSRIGFNPAASSVIAQGRILGQSASVYPCVVALGMGVEGDKVVLYRDGNSSRFIVEAKTAGVTQYLLSVTAAPATGAEYKTAFAFAADDAAQTTSGAAPVKDASVALSTILDRMSIGGFQARGGGTNGAQIIRRVAYYPRRLADAELQSLTA